MTIRKTFPPRTYETFSPPTASDAGESNDARASHAPSSSDPDKTRSAAHEAQRLASQGSWADEYAAHTPPTTMTPATSTIDEESLYGDTSQTYPSDPPPIYTPSDTVASSNIPASPVTTRAEPVPVGFSPLRTENPPSPALRPSLVIQDGEQEEPSSSSESPLLPVVRDDIESPSCSNRWERGCGAKHRRRRFKKACWLTFALVACLWLMLPGLMGRGSNTDTHRNPDNDTDNLDQSPIPSWPVPNRQIHRHETSNSIRGTFPLYDVLDLQTTSGSISVTVDPQPGSKPAVLRLVSTSGSIRVDFPSAFPFSPARNRTLQTTISASSGSVGGLIYIGNAGTADVTTNSGSITLTVSTIGIGADNKTSHLTTTTNSASQYISVIATPGTENDLISSLEARHVVRGSGSMNVEYPAQWVGQLHAQARGSGSLRVRGEGLEIPISGDKEVYAKRGKGDLRTVELLEQGSGSVRFEALGPGAVGRRHR